ncbi:MAG TPA: hypothetical protein VMY06_13435 [Sedimentisphaerales bacterium]|nr:hypothetical protein [Sedimentisphaerales bacterium]
MIPSEALKTASEVIHITTVESGKTYWLVIRSRRLSIVERNFIPFDAIKVFALTANMCTHGLAPCEWDRLEAKLKQFCEGGLL